MPNRRLLSGLLLLALAGCGSDPFATLRPEGYPFPEGFVWGVATAAHQVEGGNDKNDWWAWEQRPGTIKHGHKSGDAVAFARVYAQDADLAKGLGQNAFRMSIEWSRIEPEKGKYDAAQIRYYHDVFAALRTRGLRPFVTLFHFTLPLWAAAQGGWESQETIRDFERFAAFCAREYGADVDHWATFNEPNVYANFGYMAGTWPPGRKDDIPAFLRVMANEMVAHGKAIKALRAGDTVDAGSGTACRAGLVTHVIVIDPVSAWNPVAALAASIEDQVFNMAIIESLRTGRFAVNVPGLGQIDVSDPDLAGSADYLGINYYRREIAEGINVHATLPGVPRNDLGWEIYPDGMYRWLDRLRQTNLPLYVTENGAPDAKDAFRPRYIVQHLMRVWQAIAAGAPVKGYFYWALTDNFEWAEGYEGRFGLYRVDFERSNTSRIETQSARVYRQIATANRLSADLIREYGR
ncbi:MAG: glycoside hydrolase family 1 protein [Alphaproteobacteria bacterium]|nr:glycoside hydrolase family 1 protein [Alphaproteobacteria bacterium]